jgi:hypothetical protein
MALAGTGRASIDEKPALAGAGPMAGGADRPATNPGTPLMERAPGLLMPIARNRSGFIEIAVRFRQIAVKYPHP